MEKIYFVDDQHELNYRTVFMIWGDVSRNLEYMTACYILSTPLVFEKVESHMDDFETPVDWILRYLEWVEQYNRSWETYEGESDDALHPEHDAWIERKPYNLTSSMTQLGKLALNLWTSYDDFNLMQCLSSLDDKNIHVARCAIDMRVGLIR